MTTLSFKNDSGIWISITVIIDGIEPALHNDFHNTLHCSFAEFRDIERKHESGQSYKSIIDSFQKLSKIEI